MVVVMVYVAVGSGVVHVTVQVRSAATTPVALPFFSTLTVTVAPGAPVPEMTNGIWSVKMGSAARSGMAKKSATRDPATLARKAGEGGRRPGEGHSLIRRFAAPSPARREKE